MTDSESRLRDIEARDADSLLDATYVPPLGATDSSAMRAYDRRYLLAAHRLRQGGPLGGDREALRSLVRYTAGIEHGPCIDADAMEAILADHPEPVIGNCPECDAPIGGGLGCVHWPPEVGGDREALDDDIRLLTHAVTHMLSAHDCDRHGWETLQEANLRVRAALATSAVSA